MSTDVFVEIVYDLKKDTVSVVDTNLKESAIVEVLGNWLRAQMGKGEDSLEPTPRDKYRIRIELDLSEDRFTVQSDTGNDGLTTGIVMKAIRELPI